MNSRITRLRAMSRPRFFAYLALVGAAAGPAAWLLVLLGHLVFGFDRPTWAALMWAIPRGSLYGVVLGLILRWRWRRNRE